MYRGAGHLGKDYIKYYDGKVKMEIPHHYFT